MTIRTSAFGTAALLLFPAATWGQGVVTPDERGHLRKMTEEMVRVARTRNPQARADLFLRMAEERTRELESLQERGRTRHHDALAKAYERHMTEGAPGAVEIGAARGIDMDGAVGRCAEATSKHLEVLQRVLANAPPAAHKGLLTAIAASQRGHQQAMLAQQRGIRRTGRDRGHDAPKAGGRGEDRPGRPDAELPGREKPGRDGAQGGPPADKGPGRERPGRDGAQGGPPADKGPGRAESGGDRGTPPGRGKGPGGAEDDKPGKGPEKPGPGKGGPRNEAPPRGKGGPAPGNQGRGNHP